MLTFPPNPKHEADRGLLCLVFSFAALLAPSCATGPRAFGPRAPRYRVTIQ